MFVLVFPLFALAGCSGGLVPIQGQLVWTDGSPATELKGSKVTFSIPEFRSSARGVVQDDGSFTMSTLSPGDGVYTGTHYVGIIEEREGGGDTGIPLAPAKIDPKFNLPKAPESPPELTVEVTHRNQVVTIQVPRAPALKGK